MTVTSEQLRPEQHTVPSSPDIRKDQYRELVDDMTRHYLSLGANAFTGYNAEDIAQMYTRDNDFIGSLEYNELSEQFAASVSALDATDPYFGQIPIDDTGPELFNAAQTLAYVRALSKHFETEAVSGGAYGDNIDAARQLDRLYRAAAAVVHEEFFSEQQPPPVTIPQWVKAGVNLAWIAAITLGLGIPIVSGASSRNGGRVEDATGSQDSASHLVLDGQIMDSLGVTLIAPNSNQPPALPTQVPEPETTGGDDPLDFDPSAIWNGLLIITEPIVQTAEDVVGAVEDGIGDVLSRIVQDLPETLSQQQNENPFSVRVVSFNELQNYQPLLNDYPNGTMSVGMTEDGFVFYIGNNLDNRPEDFESAAIPHNGSPEIVEVEGIGHSFLSLYTCNTEIVVPVIQENPVNSSGSIHMLGAPNGDTVGSVYQCQSLRSIQTIATITTPKQARINASSNVNFRATPDGRVLDSISPTTEILLINEPNSNGWARVLLSDGQAGYIHDSLLEITDTTAPDIETTQLAFDASPAVFPTPAGGISVAQATGTQEAPSGTGDDADSEGNGGPTPTAEGIASADLGFVPDTATNIDVNADITLPEQSGGGDIDIWNMDQGQLEAAYGELVPLRGFPYLPDWYSNSNAWAPDPNYLTKVVQPVVIGSESFTWYNSETGQDVQKTAIITGYRDSDGILRLLRVLPSDQVWVDPTLSHGSISSNDVQWMNAQDFIDNLEPGDWIAVDYLARIPDSPRSSFCPSECVEVFHQTEEQMAEIEEFARTGIFNGTFLPTGSIFGADR